MENSSYPTSFKYSDYSISAIKARGEWPSRLIKRYEPRARKKDYAQALSFEAHDPMWMLARQWQFGRFKGDDCGSAISARVCVDSYDINGICHGQDLSTFQAIDNSTPVEQSVEAIHVRMTLYDKVQAAMHLVKMLRRYDNFSEIFRFLKEEYPLETEPEEDTIRRMEEDVNDRKKLFTAVYSGRAFDGEKAVKDNKLSVKLSKYLPQNQASDIQKEYYGWFCGRYGCPAGTPSAEESCWNSEKLAYDFSLTVGGNMYSAENYSTGHVGWYTFDKYPVKVNKGYLRKHEEYFGYIPAKATFALAPARRLWEYEDCHVQFGNLRNDDVSQLASAVIMEYVSMYSNDWMIVPLHTTPGRLFMVRYIDVQDCFGNSLTISATPDAHDNKAPEVPFTDRWALFSTTRSDAYAANNKKGDFRTDKGLFLPASLLRVSESEPIEEVQFLRDEMSNMVWGIEKWIDDGCGGSLDGKTMSDKVLSVVDSQRGPEVQADESAEFKYLIQNRVPVNWIPFIPLPESGAMGREVRFRRGRMPIYYNDGSKDPFKWVRPATSILEVKRDAKGNVIPLYLNEEEILAYGTKVTLSRQQTRWLNGSTYLWRGFAKKISGYQANSGLMFDELRKIDK